MATYTISLYKNYGYPAPVDFIDNIYYDSLSNHFYADANIRYPIDIIPIPEKECYSFDGFINWAYPSPYRTDKNGIPLNVSIGADEKWYAAWVLNSYKITIDRQGGDMCASAVYKKTDKTGPYDDHLCKSKISSFDLPIRSKYKCSGIYTTTISGGTQLIDQNGNVLQAFKNLNVTDNITIYARWKEAWRIGLNANGGVGGSSDIWYDPLSTSFYSDAELQNKITHVFSPVRSGYIYNGYFTTAGVQVIYPDGRINTAYKPTADATLNASWSAASSATAYQLSFDLNGAPGELDAIEVKLGVEVGALPTPSRDNYIFAGWIVAGQTISADTVWNIAANSVAVAKWQRAFGLGAVFDYFNLASDALLPISSQSGDNTKQIFCSHSGRIESGVNAVSDVWRNPSVVYRVVKNIDLNVTLGKAFPSRDGCTGYMITDVAIETSVGEFPLVTVSAVANEGADAINLFNLSVPIKAVAHAQNLLSAIDSTGVLQSLSLSATCDPVVCAENMMPCASDVVNGMISVRAEVVAVDNSIPSSGNGFILAGSPQTASDSRMTIYNINAVKELG